MLNKENGNISDDNIFSELSKEINQDEIIEKKQKDMAYYVKIIANILGYLNVFLVLFIIIIFSYNYLQNSENTFDNSIIKNNCSIFLGEKSDSINECMTITTANNIYSEKIKDLENKTFESLIIVLPKLAKIEKLLFSDNIVFLVRKSKTKLKPLEILYEFDKLKNNFIGHTDEDNLDEIICEQIKISNSILEANCTAYSSSIDNGIKGFNGNDKNSVKGTSITKAVSFLNYINKKSLKFKILKKQKKFRIENVKDKEGYIKKTNFKIKLKYDSNPNL